MNTKNVHERREKLAKLFDGFEAVLEQPVSSCLPDLMEMYPDAKVCCIFSSFKNLYLIMILFGRLS